MKKYIYAERKYNASGREVQGPKNRQKFTEKSWNAIPPLVLGTEGNEEVRRTKQGWVEISEAAYYNKPIAIPAEIQKKAPAQKIEDVPDVPTGDKEAALEIIETVKSGKRVKQTEVDEALDTLGIIIPDREALKYKELLDYIKEKI